MPNFAFGKLGGMVMVSCHKQQVASHSYARLLFLLLNASNHLLAEGQTWGDWTVKS